MKKAALVAAALAMVLSLAACGNRDNRTPNDPANGNGTTENNGTGMNNGSNSNNGMNDNGITGSGTGTSAGSGTGSSIGTGSGAASGTGTGTGTNAGTSTGTNSNTSPSGSGVGDDLRRAADDVGDAVTGLVDDGRSAVARGTSTTTFQRMLDNARVHDVDGVLADGENSRW
ncbi:MAG: hypothetical protein K2O45_09065 [Oscillospiraceae bacterium]|nr:hypothetical protein [Oscillospiraceae bacterium]